MNTEMGKTSDYSLLAVLKASGTLFTKKQKEEDRELVHTYKANCERLKIPVNLEEEIIAGFGEEILIRNIKDLFNGVPYWKPGCSYTGREVLMTAIQFFDQHNQPLPVSTLPPAEDIKRYLDKILSIDTPVNMTDQFRILLDITGNNIVGAANLGMMASRIMARALDTRAYPMFQVKPVEIREWNSRICQFEIYKGDKADGPGDNYYFWTHFFAATAYASINNYCFKHRILDYGFSNGTRIMTIVRPTITDHREASLIGRHVGLALVEIVNGNVELYQ